MDFDKVGSGCFRPSQAALLMKSRLRIGRIKTDAVVRGNRQARLAGIERQLNYLAIGTWLVSGVGQSARRAATFSEIHSTPGTEHRHAN